MWALAKLVEYPTLHQVHDTLGLACTELWCMHPRHLFLATMQHHVRDHTLLYTLATPCAPPCVSFSTVPIMLGRTTLTCCGHIPLATGTGYTPVPSKTYVWEQGALYVVQDVGAGEYWGTRGNTCTRILYPGAKFVPLRVECPRRLERSTSHCVGTSFVPGYNMRVHEYPDNGTFTTTWEQIIGCGYTCS